ncbi:MAG: hypothetical protein HYU99_07830 [Deltaproteobacteria bacterium]|nr:hypothetical protein [Deltaproteobacteria bacterium]
MRRLLTFIGVITSISGFLAPHLAWSSPDLSALSRINGLKLRLVPGSPEPISGLGIKTVEVSQEGPDIFVKWFSPTRIQTQSTPWPEYRIDLHRGGVSTNGLNEAESLAHPHFWIEGVVQLDRNGLLWVPPEIIESAGGKKNYRLDAGILSNSFNFFKKGPAGLVSRTEEFRTVAGAILNTSQEAEIRVTREEQKKLQEFLEEFVSVRVLESAHNHPLAVNGEKTGVPVLTVGNKYVEYTVLAIASNPLVLELRFRSSTAPKLLRPWFDFFHQYLEYQITQVYTGE